MIGIGVIGYGYWGPNLVRNFMQVPEAQVVAVSDMRADRLAAIHGNTRVSRRPRIAAKSSTIRKSTRLLSQRP